MTAIEDDWRYQSAAHLRGQAFVFKPYTRYREGWDHDHCAGCGDTFAEAAVSSGALHTGWAVTSDYDKGADYEWMCADCFSLLKDALALTPR
ncbi:hypothetical protein GCM10007859_08500 [Brevundimonas denitrificans]|uniref:Uncharacterized protein n=1 Tax=Brevundimonas denitrificans TaxID=1443434 RepID=A0ABQ6BHP2_9CAUL|nr:hypothetical protein [Brevundimonas denitrificans]GLS00841.1 hypothetical protein GCM10007859_08500 [Brevundimonas denitrificans]